MSDSGYRAVCYRCSFEGNDVSHSRCPHCNFPLIVEMEPTPPGQRIEQIFARDSLSDGAPLLPGVHDTPRKAQILAEARKRRLAEKRSRARSQPPARGGTALESGPHPFFQAVKVGLVCASAIMAGVLAAVIHSGL